MVQHRRQKGGVGLGCSFNRVLAVDVSISNSFCWQKQKFWSPEVSVETTYKTNIGLISH